MEATTIVHRLWEKGFEAFFVGGAVRDFLLGLNPKDIDIVTSATPDEVMDTFSDQKVRKVGKSFGVLLVNDTEVATYRHERYLGGYSDKNIEVTFCNSLKEDLIRRDLTINAMAMDIRDGRIIDPAKGRHDLMDGLIRFVGDPTQRITDDPNRILRACRFRAKLNGAFHSRTREALHHHAWLVRDHIVPERIRKEILKAMEIPGAANFFYALHEFDILEMILPSLANCFDFPHGIYHLEDVFTHGMIAGDCIQPKYKYLKLATYLHDVGKPIAATINPRTDDFMFKDHDKDGAQALECELRRLTFSNKEIQYITGITRYHMRVVDENMTPKGIRRLLIKLHELDINYRDIIRLRVADRKGNLKKENYTLSEIRGMKKVIEKELIPKEQVMKLAIDGIDIMTITGLNPGKEVGVIKRRLHEMVLNDPELNNHTKLIEILKEMNVDDLRSSNSCSRETNQ